MYKFKTGEKVIYTYEGNEDETDFPIPFGTTGMVAYNRGDEVIGVIWDCQHKRLYDIIGTNLDMHEQETIPDYIKSLPKTGWEVLEDHIQLLSFRGLIK